MKKLIFLFSGYLLLATTSFAQNMSFGIKGAVTTNFLTYKLEDGDDDERLIGNNTGFYIGGVANFQLSENFAIQPNLLFAMKGGSIEGLKISTMHIDVPVNFLYTTNGFFVGGGPNFSYALSGKLKVDDEDIDIFDQDEAGDYSLKKFEIGANVLLGYTFPSGLTLSASFTPGLNNIYQGEEDNEEDIVAHFKSFGFSIGYMFGKKK
jgi:hypothetical protein